MKILLSCLVFFGALHCTAQDTSRHITFTRVEIEAEYPGGQPAWMSFLNKNLKNSGGTEDFTGTIVVQFLVDTAGNTSDYKVASGPPDSELGKEMVRVVRLSGKWIPAIQNGHKVRSYKKVPISINPQEN